MTTFTSALRLLAVVMVVVVLATVTAPAPAHADVLAAAGLATLAVVGVIIIVYLIAANTADRKMSEEGPRLVAGAPNPPAESP